MLKNNEIIYTYFKSFKRLLICFPKTNEKQLRILLNVSYQFCDYHLVKTL